MQAASMSEIERVLFFAERVFRQHTLMWLDSKYKDGVVTLVICIKLSLPVVVCRRVLVVRISFICEDVCVSLVVRLVIGR